MCGVYRPTGGMNYDAHAKLIKVIKSCKTVEHLQGAYNMAKGLHHNPLKRDVLLKLVEHAEREEIPFANLVTDRIKKLFKD